MWLQGGCVQDPLPDAGRGVCQELGLSFPWGENSFSSVLGRFVEEPPHPHPFSCLILIL